MPVSFWMVFHAKPLTHVLVPFISADGDAAAEIYDAPLALPCLALSVLMAYVGVRSCKWAEADGIGTMDYTTDGDPAPDNVLFWVATVAFIWVKSFLLMHYIDIFALILTAIFSCVALMLSCFPVDRHTISMRIIGIVAFVLSILPLTGLVMEHAEATEMYVLAICVCADSLLIVGHTYDYPACGMRTVVNCRAAYVMLAQLMLPVAIGASCGLF